ncbi:MAG: acyltransferase [Acidimicrobiales bacterium]
MSITETPSRTETTPTPSLADLAAGAKADRNRAVDLYRVGAMGLVALGHWMAVAIGVGDNGELVAGNALQLAPRLAFLSWLFQVMPLFFVVGGFSSAMSLDAHTASGGRPQDWVAARLRRMVSPAMVLAATWLGLLGLAYVVDNTLVDTTAGGGLTPLAAAGAVGAAIPLWFLANYTIDTAVAPYVLPLFRRRPRSVAVAGAGAFAALEALRLTHPEGVLHWLPYLNWVLGWMLFQVMGFAWRDGLVPRGRKLVALAAGAWAAALAAVAFGPYPVAMVHFPGLANSPTHPPSAALMLYGIATSATALAAAPAVSRFLAANRRAWSAVVAGNSVALSCYLWHLSAAVAASGLFYAAGWLPTAPVGSAAWWLQKTPLMATAAVILVGIVALVSRVERRALLAPRQAWKGGQASMLATAAGLSTGVKLWANPRASLVTAGMVVVGLVWLTQLRVPRALRQPAR